MRRLPAALAVAIAILAAATGCASHPTSAPVTITSGASTQERHALADGHVSLSEYHASFRAFEACVSAAGYKVTTTGSDGGVIEYTTPTVGEEATDQCYVKAFQDVDTQWQSEQALNTAEFTAFKACLTAKGITPAATAEGIVAQLKKARISQEECAQAHGL